MLAAARHSFIQNLVETKIESIKELDVPLGLGTAEAPCLKRVLREGQVSSANIAEASLLRLNFAAESGTLTKDMM